jgi:hypothetical protein
VRFCREWADKATHCTELAITHFIDDKTEVLACLVSVVPHLFLFGPQNERTDLPVVLVPTWEDAEPAVLSTL